MLNTYSTPLRYKNFNGVEKNTTLHFHLTPRELTDWMVENMEKTERIQRIMGDIEQDNVLDPNAEATTEQKSAMLALVRILAELSNGVPTEDGEYFDKSNLDRFIHSAAYDAFRLFLFQNPKELKHFIETLLPEESVREFASVLHEASTDAEVQAVEQKKPRDRTREELLAELAKLKDAESDG